jgi:hypothetical protein
MKMRIHKRQTSDGCIAAIDLPTHVGAIRVSAVDVGGSFLSGLRAAASIANSIAQNPVMQAVLPPGTGAALRAVNDIANGKKQPNQFAGPGGKRLAQLAKTSPAGGGRNPYWFHGWPA